VTHQARSGPGDLAPGDQIAGYEIREQIGRGGMAVVYRALDLRLGRTVALKVLAPELGEDQLFRQRFIRESRAAAGVDHPHIIPVYEAGESAGVLFIAMRYVSGGDVRLLIEAEGLLSPSRAAEIASQTASALDAAHARGLVHRDVKPGNMLLGQASSNGHDHVYLSDFGLSKDSLNPSTLTSTGQFFGTLDYVSPEQIQDQPVDGRADQYALACSVVEMLTGAPPFQRADTMALMWAQMNAAPPRLSERRPELPPVVDQVLGRALAKSPASRYPSCQAFADALTDACAAVPDSAPSAEQSARPAAVPPTARPAPVPPTARPAPDPPLLPDDRWLSSRQDRAADDQLARADNAADQIRTAVLGRAARPTPAENKPVPPDFPWSATEPPEPSEPPELARNFLTADLPGGDSQSRQLHLSEPAYRPPASQARAHQQQGSAAHAYPVASQAHAYPVGPQAYAYRPASQDDTYEQPASAAHGYQQPASAAHGYQQPASESGAYRQGTWPAQPRRVSPGRRSRPRHSRRFLTIAVLIALFVAGFAGTVAYRLADRTHGTPPPTPTKTVTKQAGSTGPATVVLEYYQAIDNRRYYAAWELTSKTAPGGYPRFAAGFAGTRRDVLRIQRVTGDVVTVGLAAVQTGGLVKYYEGTYTVTNGVISGEDIQQVG
jgi:serine/threonine protein kinase